MSKYSLSGQGKNVALKNTYIKGYVACQNMFTMKKIQLILLVMLLASGSALPAQQVSVDNKYGEMIISAEAENGTLTGVITSTTVPGYSGTGYVNGFDAAGDKVTLSVNIPAKDVYRLVIRYTTTVADTFNLLVNNHYPSAIGLKTASGFSQADAGGFLLNTGVNNIALLNQSGTAGIDRVEICRMEKNIFQIDTALIDTLATAETKALYAFLQYQFGHRVISGQTNDYFSQLKTLVGKTPLLRAHDFQHYTQGYPYFWKDGGHTFGYDVNDHSVDDLISWYNSTGGKGIVAMHWHWHDPSGDLNSDAGTNTFYTEETTFDITKGVTPGTPEYDFIIRDIDSIASQLKKFQQAGIPVLWRPLHEAGGGWFWWGAKGAEPCLALWDILIERLKNHHQLHNLIWVWSTPEPDWYPGNDKVDMIGYDSYPGDYNYTNQKEMFDNLYTITRGEKLIGMTENGPIPDIDACLNGDAPWVLFMSWSNLVASQNSTTHIVEVYNHPDVLTLESDNALTGFEWRSTLYPENWYPGCSDNKGRFLHDFSYAGYQSGLAAIPAITGPVVDVTQAPYNADNTGTNDVTAIIQQAINEVGNSGGGVVYLPAGTYRVSSPESQNFALSIAYDSTILRGAGMEATFLLNTSTDMRYKDIIRVTGEYAGWFNPVNTPVEIAFDLLYPTHVIPVTTASSFRQGDLIVVTSTPTDAFIAEHKMTGHWTAAAIKGVAFLRRIDTIDMENNLIILDAPTRYPLKTRDQARVYKVAKHISECGIEHLSIGNVENPRTGWDEESYTIAGTGAYETHQSHAIQLKYAENCWVHHVGTFKPTANSGDYHLLSNGVKLNQCRFVTLDSCNFEKPQYEGGGGNGYMYTLESNDCLISNCSANDGRHNYDFKYPYSNGNVVLHCRGEHSKYASDFHMYLSMSNLFDACTFNGDFLESVFRPYGGETSMHGYSSSQSVFYNTTGEAYHPSRNVLIDSRQFGWGYIIGTSGLAFDVNVDPAEGTANGILYNTTPVDFVEGTGKGQYLAPSSLYLDQLVRRKDNPSSATRKFRVGFIVKDAVSNTPLPDCHVQLYNTTLTTDAGGSVVFEDVFGFFTINVSGDFSNPLLNKQYLIHSDTTLTLYLERETYQVTVKLVRAGTTEPMVYNSVTLGEYTQVTNTAGEVYFTVSGGVHAYNVSKTSYQSATGSFAISSDTSFTLNLLQIAANLRIRLREGTTPVNNANITVNANTLVSNSLGDALFSELPVPASYTFEVDKPGYEHKSSNVYLTRDTIVLIEMVPEQTGLDPQKSGALVICWPNPADKLMNIRLPDIPAEKTILIIDVAGVKHYHIQTTNNHYAADVSGLLSGTYLLKVRCNNDEYVRYFVKK